MPRLNWASTSQANVLILPFLSPLRSFIITSKNSPLNLSQCDFGDAETLHYTAAAIDPSVRPSLLEEPGNYASHYDSDGDGCPACTLRACSAGIRSG